MAIRSYTLDQTVSCIQGYAQGQKRLKEARSTLFLYAYEAASMEQSGLIAGSYPQQRETVEQAIDTLLGRADLSTVDLSSEIERIKNHVKSVIRGALYNPNREAVLEQWRGIYSLATEAQQNSCCKIL